MPTYIKLDDTCPDHPSIVGLSDSAFACWVRSLCYAGRHLTDGFIPHTAGRRLGTPKAVRELEGAGRWEAVDGGWMVHGYAEKQRTRAEVEQLRSRSARRQSIHRNPELKDAIRTRDGDACRYCGEAVDFTDRRGQRGGTYDHVDPNGPDTEANLVVACRACNSAKRDRTPARAGMPLRPAPNQVRSESVSKTVLTDTDTDTDTENRSTNGCTTAAADTPAARQQRITDAARHLALAKAGTRTDVGAGWIEAATRGIAQDNHQAWHAALAADPMLSAEQLAESTRPPEQRLVLPPSHTDETIADLDPKAPARIDDTQRTNGLAAVAALRARPPDDAA